MVSNIMNVFPRKSRSIQQEKASHSEPIKPLINKGNKNVLKNSQKKNKFPSLTKDSVTKIFKENDLNTTIESNSGINISDENNTNIKNEPNQTTETITNNENKGMKTIDKNNQNKSNIPKKSSSDINDSTTVEQKKNKLIKSMNGVPETTNSNNNTAETTINSPGSTTNSNIKSHKTNTKSTPEKTNPSVNTIQTPTKGTSRTMTSNPNTNTNKTSGKGVSTTTTSNTTKTKLFTTGKIPQTTLINSINNTNKNASQIKSDNSNMKINHRKTDQSFWESTTFIVIASVSGGLLILSVPALWFVRKRMKHKNNSIREKNRSDDLPN